MLPHSKQFIVEGSRPSRLEKRKIQRIGVVPFCRLDPVWFSFTMLVRGNLRHDGNRHGKGRVPVSDIETDNGVSESVSGRGIRGHFDVVFVKPD